MQFRSLLRVPTESIVRTTVISFCMFVFCGVNLTPARSQESAHEKTAEIGGVKFQVPEGFELKKLANPRVAFMRQTTEPVSLFIGVVDAKVNNQYLTNLSDQLVKQLLPDEQSFNWKVLPLGSTRPLSKHQTASCTIKGVNSSNYVQTDCLIVKAQGQEIVLGIIAKFGGRSDFKYLFEVEGKEYSISGWQGLFKLLASVTVESDAK